MNKKKLLNSVLLYMTLFFSISVLAQSEPEVLKNWIALEEADFHYDVSYSVVKCNPNSKPTVLINAFNEDGTNPKVGFTLNFSDNNGNTAQVVVAPFTSKLGDMFIASCSSEKYSNLKFDYPENIDLTTVKVEITYQTQS
ncbi:hypothetical protein H9W90_06790 [Polaribacter pectinis]|uniref:Uncharacterized protein n=1 Tax=Polaribacter pectinis TaxID=2738844 RepID=A0A7G9LDW2_9FLAO|nr:hypothetical protein [Polaribacter pectinis]QNM86811.1 hypothetical protein H9W90_06790 [Polaribacter pectinis]